MIILKIAEKGQYIEIPGMPPFRTPAEANISHVSINLVVSRLQAQGIKKFQIISDTKGKETVLNQSDFAVNKKPKKAQAHEIEKAKKAKEQDLEKRFTQLETLITNLVKKQSEPPSDQEQITNKLSSIEKLLQKKTTTRVVHVSEKKGGKKKEPKIEEMDETFIPEINLDGLHVKGETSKESLNQDKADIDDSADLLSRIMQEDN